jgi:L-serine dehydratase
MPLYTYPEFYNDVFGPVMQPGSSSHTAAPCRLGYLARNLLGEEPAVVHVLLDNDGSFAGTFGAMGEDNAMLAGALGLLPDDVRIFDAQNIAAGRGVDFAFEFGVMRESTHVNALKFVLTGRSGRSVSLVGNSTGGGMIETVLVNGYPLRTWGDAYVTLLFDREDALPACAVRGVAEVLPDLLEGGTVRGAGRGALHFFRSGDCPDLNRLAAVVPGIETSLLAPVLPVITRPGRRPQLFDTMTSWREIAETERLPLWEIAVQYEVDAAAWTRDEVIDYMRMLAGKMHWQTHAVYEEHLAAPPSPFKPDMAADWERYMRSPVRLSDDITARTIQWAYGAGAGIPGVETVAGPMGSGGGYVYAALCALRDARGFTEDDLLHGLFVAAGVGAIAFSRTEPTGERIGCTGECGICGAMAAAALVEMSGGTPAQVENAASLSLQSSIGWPCDPITGGMGQPCRSRILTATCMASVFADLALCGRDAVLPLHEAIDVADAVGRELSPDLLCTARGGASTAPAARRCAAAYRAWFEQTRRDGTVRPPGNLI